MKNNGLENASLEKELVERFGERGLTLASAESCTGGLIAKRITDIPGSSAVFKAGLVTYSEEMKERVLGVLPGILEQETVYSKACAIAMAQGALRLTGCDVAVATTGIAGPDGASERDPVGTVYIAAAARGKTIVERVVFGDGSASRDEIRFLSASYAIKMALRVAFS